ncbi:MAG: 16S rRNA (guanine(527)-N(7))-methyltransferase RsmG [Dehalococcoidia bacterium]
MATGSDTPTPGAPDGALPVLRAEAGRLGLALSEGAIEGFQRYLALLETWNDRAGLTAITDPETAQRRHFGESLALLVALRDAGLLRSGEAARVADLGPGGGFPGVPMAIADPALNLVLIESQERRCAFLRTVTEELGLAGVTVVHARAEEAGRMPALRGAFDLVVARALAAMPVLVEYALPLLREGGVLATPKGSRGDEELVEAARAIDALGGAALEPLALPLPADVPPQRVYLVRRTGPLDDRYPRRPGMPLKRPL